MIKKVDTLERELELAQSHTAEFIEGMEALFVEHNVPSALICSIPRCHELEAEYNWDGAAAIIYGIHAAVDYAQAQRRHKGGAQ